VFCLVTLVLLVLAEENWRGRRAWDKFRQEWEAKGERFDLASFLPKPVPADQNFAMTPLLAPLLDYEVAKGKVEFRDSNGVARAKSVSIYRGEGAQRKSPSQGNWQRGQFCDLKGWQAFYQGNTNFPASPQPQGPAREVLFALKKYEPVLTELGAASQRPYSTFPVHYDDGPGVLLPHLTVLKALTQLAQLQALANLEARQNENALADMKLGWSFARPLESEPLLISQLVRLSILQILIQPVWEGVVKHRWTDAELAEVQKMLVSVHLLEDYAHAVRGERAFHNQTLAQMRQGSFPGWEVPKLLCGVAPNGWLYQNQLVLNRLEQEHYLPVVDATHHRVYPERCDTNAVASVLRKRSLYNIVARLMAPAFLKVAERFARGQTAVDEAAVACALERYRLANGQLPDTLAALVPRFLDQVPPDVLDGQPLRYHPKPDGSYVLYSVGWNKTDDGGEIALTKGTTPSIDAHRGDWVWLYPAR